MSATITLVLGPAGSGKTRRLLEVHRAAAAGSPPGRALWLTPTRRAVDEIRPHLPGGLLPHALPLAAFADEMVRAYHPTDKPLSLVRQRLLVEELLTDLTERGELKYFARVADARGFADAVIGWLDSWQAHGVPADDFARAAESDTERDAARILGEYQRRLDRLRLLDGPARLRRAAELLRDGRRRPFAAARAVFLDGFSDFTPPEWDLVEALAETATGLWLSLPDEEGDGRAEIFQCARATRERMGRYGVLSTVYCVPGADPRPPGLLHLERHLFRPVAEPSADAAGLRLIEAPGPVGEARLVARTIHALLERGVPPGRIVVTARHVPSVADLLREVFGEYGIPLDLEGAEPLARHPAVATLLRAARLPDDDWPFAAVTALLRSGDFRPDWPENDDNRAQQAEALLRLVGEPRGRDTYLRAVDHWADDPPQRLEDEQAEEPRWQRTQRLAQQCRPFLRRFFAAWDRAPDRASPLQHVAWLRRLADDLGLPRDDAALERLWHELADWAALDARPRPVPRAQFFRLLASLAQAAALPRSPRGPGRVRVLSAELACHLDADVLVVMGLGERGFPDLSGPPDLLDESDRQRLRQATGLPVLVAADRRPDELLLFYRLLGRARRLLILSYAAVDEKGQELLPSSFLREARACFKPGSIPVERQRMMIEGYDRRTPRSPAERRVAFARDLATGREPAGDDLPESLTANLRAALAVSRARFHTPSFTEYEGWLRHPTILADLARRFGPDRVFSPTALEHYVACPFRFFLASVLKLEPLEEPREAVESTRRGAAVHRALARLHADLAGQGAAAAGDVAAERLPAHLDAAVAEYAQRAGSLAAKELWRLEGRRLRRSAARYAGHWKKFAEPWAPLGAAPVPWKLEADFGLPGAARAPLVVRHGDVEVRIGGRIDRIDVAELPDGDLGYWVIDYKTGRSAYYTGSDLTTLRKLQLTLYALAVEASFGGERPARPLGLAYWLVTDTGPKLVLPGTGKNTTAWHTTGEPWKKFRARLEGWVAALVGNLRAGTFPLRPRDDNCTDTCPYAQVCRIAQSRHVEKDWRLPLPVEG